MVVALLKDAANGRRERAMFKSREKSILSASFTCARKFIKHELSNAGWLNKSLWQTVPYQLEESVTKLNKIIPAKLIKLVRNKRP